MTGLILVNAYTPSLDTRQLKRFAEEFSARGVEVCVRRNDFFPAAVVGGDISCAKDFDFCLYLDKDKYVAAMLEKAGLRLFDSAAAIELCDDKMTTHIALANIGIPMPDTMPGLLCYDEHEDIKASAIDEVERRLGYPVVVKQSYGSLGKGVFKADDRKALDGISRALKSQPHLFQKYIAESAGRDLRVIVVGNKCLGGIYRISDCDFRSNIGLGGRAEKANVPKDAAAYAVAAANALGLDYCGIDFLLSNDGPLLCEVNSNAFFDGFESVTGVNVAGAYAEHIITTLGHRA